MGEEIGWVRYDEMILNQSLSPRKTAFCFSFWKCDSRDNVRMLGSMYGWKGTENIMMGCHLCIICYSQNLTVFTLFHIILCSKYEKVLFKSAFSKKTRNEK